MLLHSVSFCLRATKTYASAPYVRWSSELHECLTTEIIHFQNEWNERSSEQKKNGNLAMHGINECVRCVCV